MMTTIAIKSTTNIRHIIWQTVTALFRIGDRHLRPVASNYSPKITNTKPHGARELPTPSLKQKWLTNSIFACFLLGTCIIGSQHPWYSWDILGYIGSALSLEGHDTQTVHDLTYSYARQYIAPKDYAALTDVSVPYLHDMATNAEHFQEQLPFYKVKPLYIGAIYLLYKAGINPVHGSILISCFASVFCGILVLKWLTQYFDIVRSVAWSILLLLTAGILEFAAITVPDILSSFAILLSFYCIVTEKRAALIIMILFFAMLIRIDNIILLLAYLIYCIIFGRSHIPGKTVLGAGVLAIAILLVVLTYTGYYGWQVLFYHTFIGPLLQPAHFTGKLTLGKYLSAFTYGLRLKPPCNMSLFFIFLGMVGASTLSRTYLRSNRLFHAICIAGLVAIIHFIIFPESAPRFFFAYYLLTGIFFLERVTTMQRSLAAHSAQQQAHKLKTPIFALN